MRSQQVTSGNAALYPAIVPLCTNSSARAVCPATRSKAFLSTRVKSSLGNTQSKGKTVPASTHNISCNVRNSFYSLPGDRQSTHREPCCSKENPGIAPPVFVFHKKEQTLKRPAEDSKCESGLGVPAEKRGRSTSFTYSSTASHIQADSNCRDKRVRSSSFSCILSFPPQKPVAGNNVFMPSSLLSRLNVDNSSTEKGLVPPSVKRTLLWPAVLQAPLLHSFSQPAPSEETPGRCVSAATTPQVLQEPSALSAQDAASVEMESTSSIFLQLSPAIAAGNLANQKTTRIDGNAEFVFGENMSERVLSPLKTSDSDNEDSEDDASLGEESSSYGSESSSSEPPYKTVRRQTLRESAAAYTAASSKRCLLEQVEVFTGEEGESNVMQITCKLFVFEKSTESWLERGRGVLRLNDMATEESGNLQSRLVMRNQGNLKVILNTKLWAQMNVFKLERKKLCFTATDLESHVIRVFLIQACAKETARLYLAIHHRLVALRSCCGEQETEEDLMGLEAEPKASVLHCDSEDDER
ncbi:ran-binding protein 3-like isoform X3 [Polyodon spathula]|uniref:ran-binding protein 3-like isoform X3 n=1 Tax=Polyodon spathula TaxID=7913 RepID=UPI001B7E2DA3|nr:ran-binding protein 3-like isoform X3 [Polyodon spathula]